jgi:alpha-1,6-mannosyltransferase
MASRRDTSPTLLEPALAGQLPRVRAPAARRAAAWRNEATARRALAVSIGAALALNLVVAGAPSSFVPPSKESFPLWMVGPLRGAASWLPESGLFLGLSFTVLLALMVAAYLVVAACARHVPVRAGVGALLAVNLIFLLGPPLTLTDIFNYVNYARLGAVHGINPYAALPAEVPVDPSYPFATWHHLLSPYGPLFTLASYPLVALAGVAGAFWALKVGTTAASLACLGLTWFIARRTGREPLGAALLLGLNPLVLVYGLGGVHNDFFMVALILAGVAAVLTERPAPAGAAIMGAAGVKISAALVLPFALLATRRRVEMVLGAIAAGAAMAALSLAAFGFHAPGLDTQSRLVTPFSPPNLLGLALGQGGATAPVRALVTMGLLATVGWLLVRTARGSDWLTGAGWATLALVLSLSWEMPWYVLWPLPFAALSSSVRLRRATLALTVFLFLTMAPVTGALINDICHCSPSATETGKRNAAEIQRFLR